MLVALDFQANFKLAINASCSASILVAQILNCKNWSINVSFEALIIIPAPFSYAFTNPSMFGTQGTDCIASTRRFTPNGFSICLEKVNSDTKSVSIWAFNATLGSYMM